MNVFSSPQITVFGNLATILLMSKTSILTGRSLIKEKSTLLLVIFTLEYKI
jgi:hypothetical protein